MDFEIFSDQTRPTSLSVDFERLITNRRWIWQRWTQNPPAKLGWVVFLLVALELGLGFHISKGGGMDASLFQQMAATALVLLLVEFGLTFIVSQAADIYGTTGNARNLLIYLNLGLLPLLLFLPLSLPVWISGKAEVIRFFGLLFILIKVLGNWREAMELNYKLSRMQSAVVLYISTGVLLFVCIIGAYAVILHRVADIFA